MGCNADCRNSEWIQSWKDLGGQWLQTHLLWGNGANPDTTTTLGRWTQKVKYMPHKCVVDKCPYYLLDRNIKGVDIRDENICDGI